MQLVSVLRSPAFAVLVIAGFLLTIAEYAAADDSSVSSADATAALERHLSIITHRMNEAEAAYFYYAPAQQTLRNAFAKAGISQEIIDSHADVWANNGLASDYVDARNDVYWYHRDQLLESIGFAKGSRVRRDELDAIAHGMASWMIYETGFRALLSERVALLVASGVALQAKAAAASIVCGDVEACKAARDASIKAAEAAAADADQALSANRDALRGAREHFFTKLKSTAPELCNALTVSFTPRDVRFRREAFSYARLEPEGCASKGRPTFHLVRSEGPTFTVLDTAGMITIDENKAGWALIEGRVEVESGTVTGRARIPAAAIPSDCTGVRILPGNEMRLFVSGGMPIHFTPERCTRPDAPAVAHGDPSQVIWAAATGPYYVSVYPRSTGTATISVSVGGLKTRSAPITVVDDGEDCTDLSFSYPVTEMRVGGVLRAHQGTGLAPYVYFGPHPCEHPAGTYHFESLDPEIARIGPQSGAVFAIKKGTANVALEYGGLSATGQIRIADRPHCDDVEFDYAPAVLTKGQTSTPTVRYVSRADPMVSVGFDELCLPLDASAQFSSGNPSALQVDPSSGTVTAAAVGTAIITLRRGQITKTAEVTVVAE